jgi:hypothetical protein
MQGGRAQTAAPAAKQCRCLQPDKNCGAYCHRSATENTVALKGAEVNLRGPSVVTVSL